MKDADGTVHTRYERTYEGLPVLGGDLVVDTARSGRTGHVYKATKASLKVATLKPAVAHAAPRRSRPCPPRGPPVRRAPPPTARPAR